MSFLARNKTRITFRDKKKKKALGTQKTYASAFQSFGKFCKAKHKKSMDEVIAEFHKVDIDIVLDTLQEWINWVDISPSTIKLYFSNIKSYLHHVGIKFDKSDVKESIDFPKVFEEELHPINLEEFNNILKNARYNKKILYLGMASSGMRPHEILNIRKKDIEIKDRLVIHIPAKYTKLRHARTTFFSFEVSKMIIPKLKKLNDNDFVFGSKSNNKSMIEAVLFSRLLKRIGLDEKYESNGRLKITMYSFRAFFITKLSRHDPNFAKIIAGQKGYLLQYDRMTEEEKLELYKKYESDLIIDDKEKLKHDNRKQKQKIDEFTELKDKLDSITNNIRDMLDDNDYDEKDVKRILKDVFLTKKSIKA